MIAGSHPRVRNVAAAALAAALLLAGAGPALAGSEERKATDGAAELLIPVGPRGTALGASFAGEADGVEAIYWNPAGLATLEGTEAMFNHTRYFADMKLNYVAIGTRWGTIGEFGFTAKVLSVGDIIETTEDAPEGTGKTFSPTFAVLGATYARAFTDRVRFGATANFVSERILDASARGLAFDFGVQYLTDWRGLNFGLVMKNFGPGMQFSGTGFQLSFHRPDADPTATNRTFLTSSTAFDMPSYFTLAGSVNALSNASQRLTFLSAFQSNNFAGDNFCGGVEWGLRDVFALRGSWFGTVRGATDPLTGVQTGGFDTGDDLYTGYALGAGAHVRAGGSAVSVDVAWRPVREAAFSDILDFGLKIRF